MQSAAIDDGLLQDDPIRVMCDLSRLMGRLDIGFILACLFALIAACIFAVIGIYNLFASMPDWKLISASFAALVTTLVLVFLIESGWFGIRREWRDLAGLASPVLAWLVSVLVYYIV